MAQTAKLKTKLRAKSDSFIYSLKAVNINKKEAIISFSIKSFRSCVLEYHKYVTWTVFDKTRNLDT